MSDRKGSEYGGKGIGSVDIYNRWANQKVPARCVHLQALPGSPIQVKNWLLTGR